jgi:hypothetical protein
MPLAARSDSEYLAGTLCCGSRISISDGSNDEHPPSSLRHSEVSAVENPPGHAIPEFGQRFSDDSEVPTAVASEETGYVLNEEPLRSNNTSDSGELEEESGSCAGESCSLSGDGDVLAGWPSTEKINAPSSIVVFTPFPYLLVKFGSSG